MPFAKLLCSVTIAVLFAVGCSHGTDTSPLVAMVYGHELHASELSELVPEGISAEDSTAIVHNYVEQWIRQNVLLAKAEKNVSDDFSHQLSEYKNSLLIYAYEQQIVNQLLDTIITDAQVASYYAEHQTDFKLRYAIVKAIYVVGQENSPATKKIRSIIGKRDFEGQDIAEVESIASRNGMTGYYDADTWIPFYTLQRSVPIMTYNENLYLRHNSMIVLNDESTTYLVRILDYKESDEVSPIEMQQDNIRSIILNRRKLDVLSHMQTDLLTEAERSNNVKRFAI